LTRAVLIIEILEALVFIEMRRERDTLVIDFQDQFDKREPKDLPKAAKPFGS